MDTSRRSFLSVLLAAPVVVALPDIQRPTLLSRFLSALSRRRCRMPFPEEACERRQDPTWPARFREAWFSDPVQAALCEVENNGDPEEVLAQMVQMSDMGHHAVWIGASIDGCQRHMMSRAIGPDQGPVLHAIVNAVNRMRGK